MLCIYNGIFFICEKEHLAIHDNTDGPWGHYPKWNVRQRKINTTWSHLYINLKKETHTHTHTHIHKPIYVERELFVVAGGQGWEVGRMGKGNQKGMNYQL